MFNFQLVNYTINPKKRYLLVLVLLLAASGVYAQVERLFVNQSIALDNVIDLSAYEIYSTEAMALSRGGSFVIISEHRQRKMAKIDLNTFNTSYFGQERGTGPGEISAVSGSDIDSDQFIYLVDYQKQSIGIWSNELNFVTENTGLGRFVIPDKIAVCPNTDLLFVLSQQYSRSGLIHSYNKSLEKQRSFYKIDDRDKRSYLVTAGIINCNSAGELFFYAPRFIDFIKKFNQKGELVAETEIIDFEEAEDLISKVGRWRVLNKEAKRSTGRIRAQNGKVFTSYSGSKSTWLNIIDIYEDESLRYLESIYVEERFFNFDVSSDKRVTLSLNESRDYLLYNYTLEL
jgi:hypothetical protein